MKTLAAVAVTAPAIAQHAHDVVQIVNHADYKPRFFSKTQYETLKVLVDLIIPRTDTPGAADAGAHRIIDGNVWRSKTQQKGWQDGLAALDKKAGKPFHSLTESDQIALLKASMDTPFFALLKGATIDAYYSTKEGLSTELGWNANTYLAEFKGCTHKEHQV